MAFIQYLNFDGENLPLPTSYEVDMEDKEADSGGETEAGTIQRDVVRAGVREISVSFSVTPTWLKKLTEYKQQESITVRYFDPETIAVKQTQMYVEGFKSIPAGGAGEYEKILLDGEDHHEEWRGL